MASERILATGKIVDNEIHWTISPIPVENEVPVDGDGFGSLTTGLQRLIDEAAQLEDQIEGRLDEEFWARGAW